MRILTLVMAAIAMFLAAPAAASDNDIWNKAETAHFTIYSAGEEEDLVAFARNLEKFDGLLRFWFQKPDRQVADKIEIFLLDNQKQVGKLLNRRSVAGYYSPRIEGSHAVAHRERGGRRDLSGQRILFHEYAHHFMMSEFDRPTPAWLIEGFAEFLATTEFNDDGSWTFGKPASHRGRELRYYDDPQIERLLKWPDEEMKIITGFYGWSWALTHMLYTAPDQGARMTAYTDRLAAGEDTLEAAEAVFGDLGNLEQALRNHVRRSKIDYSISSEPFPWIEGVEVSPLTPGQSRLLELRLRRLGGADLEKLVPDLETFAQTDGFAADALTELALAHYAMESRERFEHKRDHEDDPDYEELRGPWFVEAERHADRALAVDAQHVRANILKGRILLGRLEAKVEDGEKVGREEWRKARKFIQLANRADPSNTEALYRLAHSYTQEKRESASMFDAYGAAYVRAPQTRPFRLSLAYDLARIGRYDEALKLLEMLANDPHFPKQGQQAVKRIEMMRETGAKFPPELPEDEDEDGELL